MPTKYICVVAGGLKSGMEYAKTDLIQKKYRLDYIKLDQGEVHTKEGIIYKIVTHYDDGIAYNFEQVIKSPCYSDLYQQMLYRVR